MKTYIINLKRSTERRKHIIQEVERQGLDYEIVEAVDGGAVPENEILRFADMEVVSKHRDWLSNRALATSLSHLSVYKRIVAGNEDFAMVLEDDVALGNGFRSVANAVGKNLSGAEVALLHYVSFSELQLSTHDSLSLDDQHRALYPMFLEGVGSAAAYLITQKAAQSLCDSLIPLKTAADSWNEYLGNSFISRIRMVDPMPVSVIGAKSTIYVGTQNLFRIWLTESVDRYQVPLLSNYFRRRRLANVERMSQVCYTSSPSPFSSTNLSR